MLEDCGAALVLTQRDVLERLPLPAGLASLAVDDPGNGRIVRRVRRRSIWPRKTWPT
ncbi:hypothetical protein MNU23_18490 [Pseudomonas aeruginosa]|nr:hypothetical protein [Pseudomonas aeruginosa]MCT2413661.1 hypothetical protein [Pseudomonas aeruginosa]